MEQGMVLPVRIELTTSPLPMGCSTTELRQHRGRRQRISDHRPDVERFGQYLRLSLAGLEGPSYRWTWQAAISVKRAANPAIARATPRVRNACGWRCGKISSGARRRPKDGRQAARPTIPPNLYRTNPRVRPIILFSRPDIEGGGYGPYSHRRRAPAQRQHSHFRREERHAAADDRESAHRSDAHSRQRAAARRRQ